jgi:hypothetical protein
MLVVPLAHGMGHGRHVAGSRVASPTNDGVDAVWPPPRHITPCHTEVSHRRAAVQRYWTVIVPFMFSAACGVQM